MQVLTTASCPHRYTSPEGDYMSVLNYERSETVLPLAVDYAGERPSLIASDCLKSVVHCHNCSPAAGAAGPYASFVSGNATSGNSSYLNIGAEPLAASIDEQLLRSILEKELAQKFLKLGGFAFFDGADPPNMVHCAVLTDYPSEAQAAMATYRASPPTDRPRRVAQDQQSELEMDEREASFNLSGEQHMEFSAQTEMPLHASDDWASVFYGAYAEGLRLPRDCI